MTRSIDYLIVGQGLAGTLLADLLLRRGKRIMVYDQGHEGSSTKNAAGIINPITGRRFVKSWMYDELIAVALSHYQRLEESLEVPLIQRRNIVRSLPDQKTLNDWLMKATWEDYREYVIAKPGLEIFFSHLNLEGLWCEVTGGYQVDLVTMIGKMRKRLLQSDSLREEYFEAAGVESEGDILHYADLVANYLIFAEGYRVAENIFFANQKFLNPSKGENLILRIPDFVPNKMIKKKYFLVPMHEDLFWFGAKDGWHFEDSTPSDEAYSFMMRQARSLIKVPFEVVEHRAAVRPTIRDRRPVIGAHPDIKNVYIFNGLGTKGSSLGPYWAERLIKHIESGGDLDRVVDPWRFSHD